MITSNAVGVYSDDGKHTAPPGQVNNSACRPPSRHTRLIASRAASVTTRRPPRESTRSDILCERCTVFASHVRYFHDCPRVTPPARKQHSGYRPARERRSPPTRAAATARVAKAAGSQQTSTT